MLQIQIQNRPLRGTIRKAERLRAKQYLVVHALTQQVPTGILWHKGEVRDARFGCELGHIHTGNSDASCRVLQTSEGAKERTLAAAVLPDQRRDTTGGQRGMDVAQDDALAPRGGNAVQFEQRRTCRSHAGQRLEHSVHRGRAERAVLHAQHAVGQVADTVVPMLGDHNRQPAVSQATQLADQFAGGVVIELRGRLVEQQHGRLGREHGGQRDTLTLAARQLVDAPVGEVFRLNACQRGACGREDVLGGQPVALQAEGHVAYGLGHHGLGLRVLEEEADALRELGRCGLPQVEPADVAAPGGFAAVKGRGQAGQHAQERRLAASGLALEQHDLARLDRQRCARQCPRVAGGVAVAQVLDRDGAHARHRSAPAPRSDSTSTAPATISAVVLNSGSASG